MSVPAFNEANRQKVIRSNIRRYSDQKLLKELFFASGTSPENSYEWEWYTVLEKEAKKRKLA